MKRVVFSGRLFGPVELTIDIVDDDVLLKDLLQRELERVLDRVAPRLTYEVPGTAWAYITGPGRP